MPVYRLATQVPVLPAADSFWVAPTAVVAGDVTLEEDVSIWFGAIVRGDVDSIYIGAGTNIQDNTVVHTNRGIKVRLGANCTIGHKAMLHGCTIGDATLVGMSATILNGAKIGARCLIAANSLVTQNKEFPDGSFILGSPARVVRELTEEEQAGLFDTAQRYKKHWRHYRDSLQQL
ncbi:MAG: gamma carbonic anhydrase family protein [Methylobacteriaceae bacterium]|jgi:carbonic anhydrase/acetyltransferase-like protein (isoleucine patch superfamily)|nr:gamma carbonic anhydrase family protein [Methylobacteriaceae bacterium]